jgi:hypothetical protein
MEAEPLKVEPPKRKRRWFQYRLRTLLIIVTLLAGVCGAANWYRVEVEFVRERQRLSGERPMWGSKNVHPPPKNAVD